ncbi:MAG: hypothetical protein SGI97_00645 [candidate division Zixibacteria bacterium]|nr:hypothetical protein [candidate division Zixibacteria bacterium]
MVDFLVQIAYNSGLWEKQAVRRVSCCLYCLLCSLLIIGNAEAVERKKKTSDSTTVSQTQKSESAGKQKKKEPKRAAFKAPATADRRYDSFVDKNNNGIDDRKENIQSKSSLIPPIETKPPPAAVKAPTEKKTQVETKEKEKP